MQLGKIITVFHLFYDAVSKREVIASNNGTTEATTRYFEGRNPWLKTVTKNFSGEGEGGLNNKAKSFSQNTD